MMDSVRSAVLGSGSAMRFGEAAGATVSISEAVSCATVTRKMRWSKPAMAEAEDEPSSHMPGGV